MKKATLILILLLSIAQTVYSQKKKPLIDIFYQALALTEKDTLDFNEIIELSLNNYDGEIISPLSIIAKYPDAKKYLVNDSVFVIRPMFNLGGLIEDLGVSADSKITIKNFHFKNNVVLNLKLYSPVTDEVFNSSRLLFEDIIADKQFMIWFNNLVTIFNKVKMNNLWIGNESVVSPRIIITKSRIDFLQLTAIKPARISIKNNKLGIVEINEVATKKFDIINNTFQLPVTPIYKRFGTRMDLGDTTKNKDEIIGSYLVVIIADDQTIKTFTIKDNVFLDKSKSLPVIFGQISNKMTIANNTFETPLILSSIVSTNFELDTNKFSTVSMGVAMPSTPQNLVNVSWQDLKGKLVWRPTIFSPTYRGITDKELKDPKHFYNLIGSYSRLLEVYKNYGNQDDANDVFLDMKALHLKRYEYLYRTKGGTTNFFQLYLNKLLSVYTRHGTDPAQAMTASLWIIIFFSFIYFFFPSDWDESSKSKLIKNFKAFIEKNEKGYFKPFLSLIKGLITSFFNAITLSVNSFVTLGFGTIPTKGIAKYICIFQGFLGWFLLSIFIVALINQILI